GTARSATDQARDSPRRCRLRFSDSGATHSDAGRQTVADSTRKDESPRQRTGENALCRRTYPELVRKLPTNQTLLREDGIPLSGLPRIGSRHPLCQSTYTAPSAVLKPLLSKDLYQAEPGFQSAIEPDAQELNEIRNHLEHKYLKVHEMWYPES